MEDISDATFGRRRRSTVNRDEGGVDEHSLARTDGTESTRSFRSGCTRRAFLRVGSVGVVGSILGATSSASGASDGVPGETGTLRVNQPDAETGHTISFERTYEAPVVVVKPVGFEGANPAHVRLRDVGSTGCTFRIEEWNYLDGWHTTERLFYLVVESGSHTVSDGTAIQAAVVTGDDGFGRVSFPSPFASRPVVFSQAQTYRGGHEIVTRNRNVSTSGFDVRLQEEEGRDGWHTTERIGYVAVQPTTEAGFEVGRTANAVTDESYRIDFEGTYDSPRFLADVQTYNGGNTAGLRRRNLDRSSASVFVEEERSADGETNHVPEAVGYLVTTPGGLFGDGSDSDPAGYGAGGYGAGAYGA